MPELPEVEGARRMVEDCCLGAEIVEVLTKESGGGPREGLFDEKVIGDGVTEDSFRAALLGRTLQAVRRKGKQMWFELSGAGPLPLWHFGMTGAFAIDGKDRMTYKRFAVDGQWPPRFTKAELHFRRDGEETLKLAFSDPRRFGRILLRDRPEEEPPISKLARDPVEDLPDADDFSERLVLYQAPLKAVLLDQNRLVCGVGNWVADETCFQAGIHPAATCSTLSRSQCDEVRLKMKEILDLACAVRADYHRFPEDWLFHYRWGKGKLGASLPTGDRIVFETVGGRTTAIVQRLQKKGENKSSKAKGPAAPTSPENAAAETTPSASPTPTHAKAKRSRSTRPATKPEEEGEGSVDTPVVAKKPTRAKKPSRPRKRKVEPPEDESDMAEKKQPPRKDMRKRGKRGRGRVRPIR